MSSTAPFYSSTTLSFTRSLSPFLSRPLHISPAHVFLLEEITRRIYHIYFYIFESFIIFFSSSCVDYLHSQTPFSTPSPPHRYFLLLNTHVCCFGCFLASSVVSFLLRSGCRVDTLHCHCAAGPREQQIRTTKTSYFHSPAQLVLIGLSIPATIMTATIHLIRAEARLNSKVSPVHSQRRNTIPDNKLTDHFFFYSFTRIEQKNVYFVHAIIRNPRRALCHTHFDRSRRTVATGCR